MVFIQRWPQPRLNLQSCSRQQRYQLSTKAPSTNVLKHDPGLRLSEATIDNLEMYIKDCFMFDIVRLGITQRLLQ